MYLYTNSLGQVYAVDDGMGISFRPWRTVKKVGRAIKKVHKAAGKGAKIVYHKTAGKVLRIVLPDSWVRGMERTAKVINTFVSPDPLSKLKLAKLMKDNPVATLKCGLGAMLLAIPGGQVFGTPLLASGMGDLVAAQAKKEGISPKIANIMGKAVAMAAGGDFSSAMSELAKNGLTEAAAKEALKQGTQFAQKQAVEYAKKKAKDKVKDMVVQGIKKEIAEQFVERMERGAKGVPLTELPAAEREKLYKMIPTSEPEELEEIKRYAPYVAGGIGLAVLIYTLTR